MTLLRAPDRVLTDRLELRQFRPEDHAEFARMCADPEVMRFIGPGEPQHPDLTWRSMAGFLGHWALLGYGQWAVMRREDGAFLGRTGYLDPPGWPGFELGYLLGKEYWGQGYGRESGAAALRIAFEDLKKERVISLVRPLNAPSIKLAQSLGGVFESSVDLLGATANVYVYPPPQ